MIKEWTFEAFVLIATIALLLFVIRLLIDFAERG